MIAFCVLTALTCDMHIIKSYTQTLMFYADVGYRQ